jgi:DNA ligase (NAD+)
MDYLPNTPKKTKEKMKCFSREQKEIIVDAGHVQRFLKEKEAVAIATEEVAVATVADEALLEFLILANLLYRGGVPLVSDARYDFVFLAELKRRNPSHSFLHKVEPESLLSGKTVQLPVRMLSTEKSYDFKTVQRWAKRIEKAALEIGADFESLIFKATPKLDGFAAYDDGTKLYTRGDGRRGTDISRVFGRGLRIAVGGDRGLGAGEIVVSRSYFRENLSQYFDNSRNFQASLIKEKELEAPAAEAISCGEAVFFPFSLLPDWQGGWSELADNFHHIIDGLWNRIDYDIDGIVLEIVDGNIKSAMGATRHHNRWQIAFKKNTETAIVKVLRVIPQTSRSGRVNPVAEIESTRLSGALIKRVSAHHYNMVREKGVGPGTVIKLSRSGEVIPKIEQVITPVQPQIPENCPSCGSKLIWDNDFLLCINNMKCPAQITHAIGHFFKTIGNIDGFGPASINKIYEHDISTLSKIYALSETNFVKMGFGPKQSENMVAQLQRSRYEQIEDWRFLAAFGVYRMGMGNCEKLLSIYPLGKVFELTREEVTAIKGFKEKTADAVVDGMKSVSPLFKELYSLNFNLARTPLFTSQKEVKGNFFTDKLVVFTGAMEQGSRDVMKKQAKALGAKIGSTVTGKTDILVAGMRVGGAKIKKAEEFGVSVISEQEYLDLAGR